VLEGVEGCQHLCITCVSYDLLVFLERGLRNFGGALVTLGERDQLGINSKVFRFHFLDFFEKPKRNAKITQTIERM